MSFRSVVILAFGGALFLPRVARAQSFAPTYWQDIRPVLRKHCTVCHSAKNLKEPDISGGLALDTFAAVKKGSKHAVLAAKANESLLVKLIETTDAKKRMPLDAKPLPQETIALIRRWIDAGAPEGKPIDTTPNPVVVKKSTTARKLDVVFTTNVIPPAGLLGKTNPGKLELAAKIGPLSPVAAVAFSPDGKYLATGSYGLVAVWDLSAGKPAKLLTNVLGAVHDLKFNPAGTLLAVAGGQPSGKGEIRLYQTSEWKLRDVLRGHDDVVFSVAFSPDGTRLASASFDHTVCLWDPATHQKLKTFSGHSDFVYAVAFSPDGKKLASAGKDRIVRLIETDTGKSIFTFGDTDQDVMALAYRPDGKVIVSSGFDAGFFWWDAFKGERVRNPGSHSVATQELVFSKDGKRLVSAGADRTMRIWDGVTGAALRTVSVGSSVYAVAISSNNKVIATGSFDGIVRLWDEATARPLASMVSFTGNGEQPDWLVITPEGYAAASEPLSKLARWRMSGQEIAGPVVWSLLHQPDPLARALRGEPTPAPKFDKKK